MGTCILQDSRASGEPVKHVACPNYAFFAGANTGLLGLERLVRVEGRRGSGFQATPLPRQD